ncbi:hypothetical protein [Chondrinema litorale]|uniref:hypothetical protein n=1 Tax=Chondrinema litorale TaxID=2994555 RepID=UPI002542DA05|nr:hypothetical protein [Chondrinema litorale]UZR99723.1 hypothetical protein OQ292_38175 [Chondrinema litorale]
MNLILNSTFFGFALFNIGVIISKGFRKEKQELLNQLDKSAIIIIKISGLLMLLNVALLDQETKKYLLSGGYWWVFWFLIILIILINLMLWASKLTRSGIFRLFLSIAILIELFVASMSKVTVTGFNSQYLPSSWMYFTFDFELIITSILKQIIIFILLLGIVYLASDQLKKQL